MSKTLWAAKITAWGINNNKPMELRQGRTFQKGTPYEHTTDDAMYWDKTGNYDVTGPGLHEQNGYTWFASFDKPEVELWISGAQALARIIREGVAHK